MNENPIDNYISSSIYDDDFEKEKIMAESFLSLNERDTEYLSSEEIVLVEEKSRSGLKRITRTFEVCNYGRREIQACYNNNKFECRKRAESGGNSHKTLRGYWMVS